MSTQRSGRETPSSARTAARLFAEFAGFTALLFVTRFIARGHLVPESDQECHIGGIAADVLAHGIRFPLLVYAPNEYDNGSFFSGLLASGSFSLLGQNLLALKLVTLMITAAGAVATLSLLRSCLEELGLTSRRVRWTATAALLIAIACAPRLVTLVSMYAVGNHAEGAAIDTILLALFARRQHTRSAIRIATFWALVGFALYVNKGTALVIPVLGAAEIALAWRSPRRLGAAFGGFVLGVMPEILVIAQRRGMGCMTMASKAERTAHDFPRAFIDSILFLGEYRIELLGTWALAIFVGVALLVRSGMRLRHPGEAGTTTGGPSSFTLALVLGVTGLHLGALAVMANGGMDAYAIYAYPTLAVLFALLVACVREHAAARWGESTGAKVGAALIALTLVIHRPDAVTWGFDKVSALWRNRAGAACYWRFAEGFEREQAYGLASPGQTREQHAIERCRSFSGQDAILDCIGGIARELNWRQGGKITGDVPAELSAIERRAYAYHYGTHRKGNTAPCSDFESSDLAADCLAATQLECLAFGDTLTRIVSGRSLGRPRCTVPEPPMDGYWAAMRMDLLSRTTGSGPDYTSTGGDFDLKDCKHVFDACY